MHKHTLEGEKNVNLFVNSHAEVRLVWQLGSKFQIFKLILVEDNRLKYKLYLSKYHKYFNCKQPS